MEFEEFYYAYIQTVRAECRKMNVPSDDWDDIAQTAMLKLWQRMDALVEESEDKTDRAAWLASCVRKSTFHEVLISRGFKTRRNFDGPKQTMLRNTLSTEKLEVLDIAAVPGAEEELFNRLEDEQRYDEMWAEVGKLSPRSSEALTLRYYNELSVPEIAEKMGLEYRQVQAAISYGKVAIVKSLKLKEKS